MFYKMNIPQKNIVFMKTDIFKKFRNNIKKK